MPSDNVRRDLHIGLRVLVKERAFCALAITVLALGIGGVTTMFSVVNGVMLRGFSFPNADRLTSVNFIDPSSTNFFGANGQISSMDFEEFRPAQKSFEHAGGLPERLHRERHRRTARPGATPAPTSPRTSCAPSASSPALGRDFTAADNQPGRREGRPHRPRHLAAGLRGRPEHRGQGRAHQRHAGHDHRRHAQGLRVSDQRRALDSALQRVPGAAARGSAQHQPGRPGRPQAGRQPRSGATRSSPASPSASPRRIPTPTRRSPPPGSSPDR